MMNENPFEMTRCSRIAILAGFGTGIVVGLGAFIAGQIMNKPIRLSMPGMLVVIGTMTLFAAIGFLRSRTYPVIIRKPVRKIDFRPRRKVPIRYWGLLTFCIVATVFFFVSAIRMFSGWIPEGMGPESQQPAGAVTQESAQCAAP